MGLYMERLSDKHMREVSDFNCGVEYQPLADFLKNEAFMYDMIGEGNTYVSKSDRKEKK